MVCFHVLKCMHACLLPSSVNLYIQQPADRFYIVTSNINHVIMYYNCVLLTFSKVALVACKLFPSKLVEVYAYV